MCIHEDATMIDQLRTALTPYLTRSHRIALAVGVVLGAVFVAIVT